MQMIDNLPDAQDCSWETSQQLGRFTGYYVLLEKPCLF